MTRARTNADNVTADIAGITAGTGITGGGTSGTVTITNDMATTIAAAGDLIYGTANDAYAALSLGTAGKVLKVNSGATAPEWAVDPTTDVVTTAGDLIYGTGADAVARLGIGTAGQLLKVNSGATAPEWGAAPESGGMTLLSTTTLSGATVTISSINQTYNNLVMVISGVTNATGTGTFTCNPNNDATLCYSVQFNAGNLNNFNDAPLRLTPATGGSYGPTFNNSGNAVSVTINNYSSTTAQKPFIVYGSFNNNAGQYGNFQFGRIATTSAITSLVFSNSGGNLSTGTVLLYGVK